MQILLTWKCVGLVECEAQEHWNAALDTWKSRYQPLVDHDLRVAAVQSGSLFCGLLYVPDMFAEWQEIYDDGVSAVMWAGISHNLLDVLPHSSGANMNARFLSALQDSGDLILRELNGRFVVAVLNRAARTLRVITNNYGTTPCFWTRGKYGVAVGTRIAPLLDLVGRERAANRIALGQMFALTICQGLYTSFEGVDQVEPGMELLLSETASDMQTRRYFSFEDILEQRCDFGSDYLRIGSETFTTTIARQMRHARMPLMNLTGGMDSRVMLASALRLGFQPECDVSGMPESKEIAIAAQVADAAQITLHRICPGEQYAEQIQATLDNWSLWTEGMISAHEEFARSAFALSPALRPFFRPHYQRFSGIDGEVGRDMYYGTDMLFERTAPATILARIIEEFQNEYVSRDIQASIDAFFRQVFQQGLQLGLEHDQLANYCLWYDDTVFWSGLIASMQEFGRHVYAPFCQPMMTSVFFCMSLEEKLSAAWHRYHIMREQPQLLTIPFLTPPRLPLNGALPVDTRLRRRLIQIHPQAYHAARYLKNAAQRAIWRSHLSGWSAERGGAYFRPYLHDLLFSKEIWWTSVIKYEQGKKAWKNFLRGRDSHAIWGLATIELWARNFLGSR